MKKILSILIALVLMPALGFAAQGDGTWTRSNSSAYGVAGDAGSAMAVCFPYDNNGQPIVVAFEAKGINAADELVFYEARNPKSGVSTTTLTQAFCGGTTTFIHTTADVSGGSIYCVDSGSGIVGYFEPDNIHDATATGELTLEAGLSNFSVGTGLAASNLLANAGYIDLSGVTFGVGSRVFAMTPRGRQIIANTTVAKDNTAGLVAAPKGSPLLVYFEPVGSSAAFRLNYVTVKYE